MTTCEEQGYCTCVTGNCMSNIDWYPTVLKLRGQIIKLEDRIDTLVELKDIKNQDIIDGLERESKLQAKLKRVKACKQYPIIEVTMGGANVISNMMQADDVLEAIK